MYLALERWIPGMTLTKLLCEDCTVHNEVNA